MSDAPRNTSTDRRRRQHKNRLVVGGVLAVLAVALLLAARDMWTADEVEAVLIPAPEAAVEQQTLDRPSADTESNVIDDGKSLWVSPTDGPPIDLHFMHSGVELVVALRPSNILSDSEGEKVLAALGPFGALIQSFVHDTTGLMLPEIDQLIVGWRIKPNLGLVCTQLVYLTTDSVSPDQLTRLQRRLTYSPLVGDHTFVFAGERAFYMRDVGGGPRFVESSVKVLADFFPPEPLLPRDVERLIRRTDSDRDVTFIFRPQFLLGEQHDWFVDKWLPMRQSLEKMFGSDISAVAVSADLNENLFVELEAVPTLDSSPMRLSQHLWEQVQSWPTAVERAVLDLDPSPYGRRVVARLPEMMRRLAAYTRSGHDRNVAILRCYLPRAAGHNLLMAAELALAEGQGTAQESGAARPLAEASSSVSIEGRLQKKTTLRFGREELEAALDMLSDDVGVPITIRGQDLQLDGITRNQLFAIDLTNRPAEEILVEILRRANPDKTATGPGDPRQKLVYIVGPRGIIITTRSQAAARGETLPAAFRAE